MRIHYLAIDGIGPFGKRHEIDFDALTAGGLFLLEGPTGAGKSTIIDAIVFALYGSLADTDKDRNRIRSTHKPNTEPSTVEMAFSVSSGSYYVKRTPKWEAKKSRGEGTTTKNATALLVKLDGEADVRRRHWHGTTEGTRADDVGTRITELLSLNREQFVQTIVLPQGKFAEFMNLSSTNRADLLHTLFDTKDYQALTKRLSEQSANATKTIAKARAAVDTRIDVWMSNDATQPWHDELADLRERFHDPSDDRITTLASAAGDVIAQQANDLTAQRDTARTKVDRASAALDEAQRLASAIEEKKKLTAKREELTLQAQDVQDARAALARHESAKLPANRIAAREAERLALRELLPRVREIVGAESTVNLGALEDCHVFSTNELCAASSGIDKHIEAFESDLDDNTRTNARLGELAKLESDIPGRRIALDKLADRLKELTASRAVAETKLRAIPESMAELRTRVDELDKQISLKAPVETQLEAIRVQLKRFDDLELAQESQMQAQATYDSDFDIVSARDETYRDLNLRWLQSQATHLAQTLQDDEPCPVCGSTTHPAPAEATNDAITLETVEKAQAQLDASRKQLAVSQGVLIEAKTKASQLKDDIGALTRTGAKEEAQDLENQLADITTAQARKIEIAAELVKLDESKEQLSSEISSTGSAIARIETEIESDEARLANDIKAVEEARGRRDSIAVLLEESQALRSTLTKRRDALASVKSNIQSLSRVSEEAQTLIAESSMTEDEILASVMDQDSHRQITRLVEDHDRERTRVEALLAQPTIANITGNEEPNVDAARAAFSIAEEEYTAVADRASIAKKASDVAERDRVALLASHNEWKRVVEDTGPMVRLAQLANAESTSQTKVSLPVWVLIRRFEMVLECANAHLLKFSNNRYALERTDEGGRERKVGLGLQIIDYEGSNDGPEYRAIKSLSGGETFYTSLSLALGLSEVVQAENGGVHIETLLIDEGFGTLSQDVLDDVMNTLTELSSSGRSVGIISHVEELKSIVPNRLTITPAANGQSEITVVS